MKLKKIIIPAAVSLMSAALTVAAVSDMALKTTEYTLKAQTAAPFKITALSDLHFAWYGKDYSLLLDAIRRSEPDVIFLVGDFYDYHAGQSNAEKINAFLRSVSEIADTYITPGNHDKRYDVMTGERCMEYARNCGVTVIDGNYCDIEIKGQRVRIGGMFDHSVYLEDYGDKWHDSPVYKFLKEFEDTDAVKLLLMHRPNTFIYTDDEWDVDAVFSGHDHGGIWRLPLVGGVYAPEQGFFPEYDKGEYEFGRMKMFLSAGLEGYYIVPRLFNRPEILSVTVEN